MDERVVSGPWVEEITCTHCKAEMTWGQYHFNNAICPHCGRRGDILPDAKKRSKRRVTVYEEVEPNWWRKLLGLRQWHRHDFWEYEDELRKRR